MAALQEAAEGVVPLQRRPVFAQLARNARWPAKLLAAENTMFRLTVQVACLHVSLFWNVMERVLGGGGRRIKERVCGAKRAASRQQRHQHSTGHIQSLSRTSVAFPRPPARCSKAFFAVLLNHDDMRSTVSSH